jgi:hypothetical protein
VQASAIFIVADLCVMMNSDPGDHAGQMTGCASAAAETENEEFVVCYKISADERICSSNCSENPAPARPVQQVADHATADSDTGKVVTCRTSLI